MLETLPEDVTIEETEVPTNEERREERTETPTEIFVPEDGYTFRVDSAPNDSRSSFAGLDYSSLDNVWTLNINGGSYRVLFPKTEDLVVVDGVLVNIGTSNITGVVLGNTMDLSTYFQRTFTVLPLMSSNSQNNAYRYGAHSYLTVYSVGTTQTLSQQQIYGDASVSVKGKFGHAWSSVNVVIIGLLALQVLISFIGGLLRRA